MDHNATIPGLLNPSALRIANDNCVRITIVPGIRPVRTPIHGGSANYEAFGEGGRGPSGYCTNLKSLINSVFLTSPIMPKNEVPGEK
jgi:hypothetical protein